MTVSAACRLSPRPPALVESTKMKQSLAGLENFCNISPRFSDLVVPSSRKYEKSKQKQNIHQWPTCPLIELSRHNTNDPIGFDLNVWEEKLTVYQETLTFSSDQSTEGTAKILEKNC